MTESNHRLEGFEGNPISVKGEIELKCRRKEKIYKIEVVDVNHEPLLSANACKKLAIWSKYVLSQYRGENKRSRQTEGRRSRNINNFKDMVHYLKLDVDENVKTKTQPARRNELKAELQN